MMVPPHHRHSVFMPLDLNQDQNHDELFTPNHHGPSSSFSSLSYPILFNPPDQDQEGSHCWEPKHSPNEEEDEKIVVPSSGSWDNSAAEKHESSSKLKLRIWKKEERDDENLEGAHEDGSSSVKWMSSKMRIMRKMIVSDQRGTSYAAAGNTMQRCEDQKQPLSPVGTDNSSNNYSNSNQSNNNTVRVCADCNTTKTPLWRSGPRGPKTLCNACGIRQRKARRAMAAAAAAASGNGTILVTAESSLKNRNKLQKKEKNKSNKIECAPVVPQIKKKRRAKPSQTKKKFGFEDLTLSLSKNLASLQQVFPQDEKEAAILLMALSYGLVHG